MSNPNAGRNVVRGSTDLAVHGGKSKQHKQNIEKLIAYYKQKLNQVIRKEENDTIMKGLSIE